MSWELLYKILSTMHIPGIWTTPFTLLSNFNYVFEDIHQEESNRSEQRDFLPWPDKQKVKETTLKFKMLFVPHSLNKYPSDKSL